jgi:L-cysteine desulfidase
VDSPLIRTRPDGAPSPVAAMEAWLKTLTLNELMALTDELDEDDFAFLREGVDVNVRLAEQGLKYGLGLGVGKTLERLCRQGLIKKDMMLAARILASAAADARMSGASLPAMSSAGSGNHGLTAILPIWAVKDYVQDVEIRDVLEAVALSHIVTAFVKAHTGRLSAICGCSVAAGAGATAGITFLLGGDAHHIAGAIKNLLEDLAGIICDGAKTGCALKLATAAGTAVQAALFSLQGVNVHHTDGIIGLSSEDTMRNVGTLAVDGMIQTDQTILQIMLKKRFSDV